MAFHRKNFKNDADGIKARFKPVTVKYDSIVDEKNNKYFGFYIDEFKILDERIRDSKWNIRNNYVRNFGDFWEIELIIAGLLLYINKSPDFKNAMFFLTYIVIF